MKKIPFSKLGNILINAYKPMYPGVWLTSDVQISFDEYVRSQIHFNLLSPLFGRTYATYYKSLMLIDEGDKRFLKSFKQTIFWFYEDVALSALHSMKSLNIGVRLNLDMSVIEKMLDVKLIDEEKFQDCLKNAQMGMTESNDDFDMNLLRRLVLAHQAPNKCWETDGYWKAILLLYSKEKGFIVSIS